MASARSDWRFEPGTTQSAISRIEKDKVSPTFETLSELLYLLGEDLTLGSEPRDAGFDFTLNEETLRVPPGKRVERGLAFADFVRRNRGRHEVARRLSAAWRTRTSANCSTRARCSGRWSATGSTSS